MADKTLAALLLSSALVAFAPNDSFYVGAAGGASDAATTWADIKFNAQKASRAVYAEHFLGLDGVTYKGVKADGKKLVDCTFTSAGTTVSSASYSFTAADVGKLLVAGPSTVEDVRAPGVYTFRGTISSVAGGVATVSGAIGNTSSGNGVCRFGTDDTAVLQEAWDVVGYPNLLSSGSWGDTAGGALVVPAGIMMVTTPLKVRTKVAVQGQGRRQSEIFWASAGDLGGSTANAGVINGYDSNGSTRTLKDVQFRDLTINAYSAKTTTYNYNCKTMVMTYCTNLVIMNCGFLGSPATGIGVDYIVNGLITGNYIENPGRLFSTGGGGGSGIDFQSNKGATGWAPLANNEWEGYMITNNVILNPAVSGIRNTNNYTVLGVTKTIIMGNRIITNKAIGKGIEDCGNSGAIIIGNYVENIFAGGQSSAGNAGVDQEQWGGIHSYGGQSGIIMGNRIKGYNKGVRLLRFLYSGSNLLPDDYIIVNNQISDCYDRGISLEVDSTYALRAVDIQGNHIRDCGGEGIGLTNAGTGGTIYDLMICNNRIRNCGKVASGARKSGIYINTAVDGLLIDGNYIHDDQGTPTIINGITVDGVAVANEFIKNNHVKKGITTAFNLVNSGTLANGAPTGNYN